MPSELMALWSAAVPLMGSPGPATLSLAGIGVSFGARRGFRYLVGIVLGTTAVLLLIATGITGLVLSLPFLVDVLMAVALAYILYLAWRIATAPPLGAQTVASRPPALASGLILALTNPKAFAAIGAVYASHDLMSDPLNNAVAKVSALVIVIVAVNGAWLALGSVFSTILTNPRSARVVNIGFALCLVATVVWALLKVPAG